MLLVVPQKKLFTTKVIIMIKHVAGRFIDTTFGAITVSIGTISMSIAQIFELLNGFIGTASLTIGLVTSVYTAKHWREKYLTAREQRLGKE